MRLEIRPTRPMMPAHELTTLKSNSTEASHAADAAHRVRINNPIAATTPTSAPPIEAPPMTMSAMSTRPTADGSEMKVMT